MITYVYDGSFEGLLTAVYEAYYRRQEPDSITMSGDLQENLFMEYVFIETNPEKADKVYNSIRQKISFEALQNVFYVYLSEHEEAALWIYKYLQLGWKIGRDVDKALADERVLRIHNLSRKVSWERHRLLGLIRFKKLQDNIYYAQIEPDYNVIGLVAPHFAERLADQNWIIHDVKRGTAAIYNCLEWIIAEVNGSVPVTLDKEEPVYQNLWKQYFKSIAIQSKINPRLQRSYMPVRYWKHLIEKQR